MNAIAKYERRHSIQNDDISLGRFGGDDSSIDTNSVYSSSSRIDETTANVSRSLPQHLRHRWSIDESDISELPEIYPRLSSPLIVRDCDISKIGDQLWSFLRANQIRSAYDRQEGRVLCCTNRVSFVVQFWKRRIQEDSSNATASTTDGYFPAVRDDVATNKTLGNEGFGDEEIILEIQRRKGCSWSMHKIRSAMKKWILRKQHQQQPTNHKSRFPQPLMQRRNSERFGLVGLEPMLIASKITPVHTKSDNKTAPTTAVSKDGDNAPTNMPASSSIPTVNKPLFSCNLPPLRPTFGVCPQPYWRRTDRPSTMHKY